MIIEIKNESFITLKEMNVWLNKLDGDVRVLHVSKNVDCYFMYDIIVEIRRDYYGM